MGTLVIKSQRLSTSANYEDSERNLIIDANYEQDPTNGTLNMLSGSVNDSGDQKTYIGNFNSRLVNGELQFNFSSIMDLTRLGDVAASVNALKNEITSQEG